MSEVVLYVGGPGEKGSRSYNILKGLLTGEDVQEEETFVEVNHKEVVLVRKKEHVRPVWVEVDGERKSYPETAQLVGDTGLDRLLRLSGTYKTKKKKN